MAYIVVFNTKILEGSKLDWIKIKIYSYVWLFFPFMKKKISKKLSNSNIKPLIIQNPVGKFYVEPHNDTVWKSSQYFEYYLQHYLDTSSNKKLFIDIWANIWFYSLLALRHKWFEKALVFEANPTTYKVLKKNIELNELTGRARCFNVWLGDGEGSMSFLQDSLHTWRSRFISENEVWSYSKPRYNVIKVDISSLDNILKTKKIEATDIGFIKIDVEWFELQVLKWMEDTLSRLRNGTKIFIEIRKGNSLKEKSMELLSVNWFELQENLWSNYLLVKSNNA